MNTLYLPRFWCGRLQRSVSQVALLETPAGAPRARIGARRVALVATLVVLVLAAPNGAQGGFPDGPHPIRFFKDHGWIDGTATELSEYDVVEAAWWNSEGQHEATLAGMKALNPDVVRVVYVNPLGLSTPEVLDPDHIVNRFLGQVADEWYMRTDNGELIYFPQWPHMPLMNLSTRCPRVNGKNWNEFFAEFVANDVLASGYWEAIHWDNSWVELAWANTVFPGSFDLDLNGVADHPDSLDAWFAQGIEDMHVHFRSIAGPEPISLGNGMASHYDTMHGRYFEAFPRPSEGGWSGAMLQADAWNEQGEKPTILQFVTRSDRLDYQRVRFGIASSLLVDGGMFYHEPDVDPVFNLIPYDELQIDLGWPIGARQELDIDFLADYDIESGAPAGIELDCWNGDAYVTYNQSQVIDGTASILGQPEPVPGNWNNFMCTIPSEVPLVGGRTYTFEMDYRIVEAAPAGAFFYVSAKSDVSQSSNVGVVGLYDEPTGAVGHVREEFTLGQYSDYYLYFGVQTSGRIVIDNIKVIDGFGGVFRRDYDEGVVLANPTQDVKVVELETVYHKINGDLDPVNNGDTVSTVTLQPLDGIILMRAGPAGVDPSGNGDPVEVGEGDGSPQVIAPVAFPNPAPLQLGPIVSLAGLPPAGLVQIYSVDGRLVRAIDEISVTGVSSWDLRNTASQQVRPGVYFAVVRDGDGARVRTLKISVQR